MSGVWNTLWVVSAMGHSMGSVSKWWRSWNRGAHADGQITVPGELLASGKVSKRVGGGTGKNMLLY